MAHPPPSFHTTHHTQSGPRAPPFLPSFKARKRGGNARTRGPAEGCSHSEAGEVFTRQPREGHGRGRSKWARDTSSVTLAIISSVDISFADSSELLTRCLGLCVKLSCVMPLGIPMRALCVLWPLGTLCQLSWQFFRLLLSNVYERARARARVCVCVCSARAR